MTDTTGDAVRSPDRLADDMAAALAEAAALRAAIAAHTDTDNPKGKP